MFVWYTWPRKKVYQKGLGWSNYLHCCWSWWTIWPLCKSLWNFYVIYCQLLPLVCFKFSIKIVFHLITIFLLLQHELKEGRSNYSIGNYCCDKANSWSSWEEQITRCNIHLFLWRCWYWSGNSERHTHSPGFIYWKFKGILFVYVIARHNVLKWVT